MKRQKYNEVYGYMPQFVIDNLSKWEKEVMMVSFLLRKPTPVSMFIAVATVSALGEQFAEYLLDTAAESLEVSGEEINEENLKETISGLMDAFAADTNILREFIEEYVEETGAKLPTDDVEEKVNTIGIQEDAPKKEVKRDSKGRFVKTGK